MAQDNNSPINIKVQAGENSAVNSYYSDVCLRVDDLHQNLAPHVETTEKAEEAILNIEDELRVLEDRRAVLLQQQSEYEGIVLEANNTHNIILKAHEDGLADANKTLFRALSGIQGCEVLLDESRDWFIDLAHMPTFGLVFISEVLPEDTGEAPDENLSSWMDNINK